MRVLPGQVQDRPSWLSCFLPAFPEPFPSSVTQLTEQESWGAAAPRQFPRVGAASCTLWAARLPFWCLWKQTLQQGTAAVPAVPR